ncbi:MAG: c-type cytochrome [Bdellovibrionia bacterium]
MHPCGAFIRLIKPSRDRLRLLVCGSQIDDTLKDTPPQPTPQPGAKPLIQSFTLLILHGTLAFLFACTPKAPETPQDPMTLSIQRGKVVYQTQCTACHHSDPKRSGSIGPDVYGSSKELLEARILRGEYPKGYTPKRASHIMQALPHLKNEIQALYDYLNQSPGNH